MTGLKLLVYVFCVVFTESKHILSIFFHYSKGSKIHYAFLDKSYSQYLHLTLIDTKYITACKLANPNEDDCVRKSAQAAIPHLVKGDSRYKIPVLSPLKLDKAEVDNGPSLKLTLTKLTIYGLEGTRADKSLIDPVKKRVEAIFKNDWLNIISDYSISGQILILPITGNGADNMTFYDVQMAFIFDYELIKQADGKEYAKVTKKNVQLEIPKASFQFDNLFNGNKELGDNMNKLLNENVKEVVRDMVIPLMSKMCLSMIDYTLGNIFAAVPYNELLV